MDIFPFFERYFCEHNFFPVFLIKNYYDICIAVVRTFQNKISQNNVIDITAEREFPFFKKEKRKKKKEKRKMKNEK
jgi:hypothetical protein